METGQHPQLFLAGCFAMLCTGIAAGKIIGVLSLGALMLPFILLLLVAVLLVWRRSHLCWLVFLLLFMAAGMVRFVVTDKLPGQDISHFACQEVKVTGTLRAEPRVTEDLTGQKKLRYEIDLSKVKVTGQEQEASGGMYVYSHANPQEIPTVQVGDEIQASGKVRIPQGYQNPGQLDTKALLKAQGITASLSTGKRGITVTPKDTKAFARWIISIREHYRNQLGKVMSKEDAAAVFAMLFGGYEGIKPELLQDFTATGIVHILSVSGSHISLLAAVMAWLSGLLRLPKGITAVMVMGAITLYSILSGCVPPVIRSGIMGGLTFLALALEREKTAGYILLLTGMVMVAISPLLLFHISFQLSFLATAGLLFLAPGIRQWLRGHQVPELAAGSLAITIGAQVMALPVLAWYFNQLSFSSLLANLLAVPVIELILVAALFAGLAALVLPLVGAVLFTGVSLLLGFVAEILRILARLPASQIWVPSPNVLGGAVYYLLLGWFLLKKEQQKFFCQQLGRQRRFWAAAGALGILVVGGWRYGQTPELSVHFVDVGQGDCCLVVTPKGHAFLFDTGGTRDGAFDVGGRVVVPYLLHYGVRSLDAVFLTHAHEDHAAGCGSILHKLPVGKVYTGAEGLSAYARSMGLGDNDPVLSKLEAARQGSRLQIDGVTIEVLYAPVLSADMAAGNEASNVYRVSYGGASFLLTGDLTKEREQSLLQEGINPESTVIKAGHHGSDTSSSEEFLQAVHPRWAVFCVGRDNSFGHPKESVLKRYQGMGSKIYRTDEDGAVVFHTNGRKMQVETYGS
ncbi:MAG: DNA internalization-related competence protein ComEC/Rec2 [Selenomonas sp.]|uniref:DNA internalization-related competence protein ComEC/Rec2 n=1 Tax=Selenomonas sp. TaxID=2053611 RepID=UPI0025FA8C77|nr:DNA internalization-related competence protein ComEC/Rec2 [Selenomonas sp.]MCR5438768.1 DNA internalization-related competence protein ComEC/Rec2 [Selenomonas sp.]